MASHKEKKGLRFMIGSLEFIYEGARKEESSIDCAICGKWIKGKVHTFNSVRGYDDGGYESRFVGSTCINKILK